MRAEAEERRVAEVVASVTGEPVHDADRQLELDSLAQAELTFVLEEQFGVALPDARPARTVREASAAVARARAEDRGSPPALRPGIGRLQRVGVGAVTPILRGYYRFRAIGAERVPRTGPVVLASNHESLLDVPFLVMATPREVWFMAKEELFRGSLSSWLFHATGGFPVGRGTRDVRAVRTALAVLRAGRALAVYPEGTRSRGLIPFLSGAAWLALAEGAPLVPVGIRGTAEAMPRGSFLPRPGHVSLVFGEPLVVSREDDPRRRQERARELTERLRGEVDRLRTS